MNAPSRPPLLARLAAGLPKATNIIREGVAVAVNQEALRGDPDKVRRAIKALPNTSDLFPVREAYLKPGYALKASLGNTSEAFELFLNWALKWPGNENGSNTFDSVEADWRRMKGPFKIGFRWLAEQAHKHSAGAFDIGSLWYEEQAEPLFPAGPDGEAAGTITPLRAGRVSLHDLENLPPRQWLYGYKIQRRYVTILASPGGVGKTSFVFAMALACAARRKLLHDTPHRQIRVWVYNLEDDIVELRRRLAAAHEHFELSAEVLDDIRLNSGRDRRFRIVRTGADGGYIVEPDFSAVIDEMQREKIDVLVVDPYLRSHGVPENDNPAQDEVLRLYAQIAEATNGAILLVHHVKKGAAAGDLDSLRGGSTQGGGARSVLTLAPMSVEEAKSTGIPEGVRRSYVRLDDAKNNMAPTAQAEWIFLHSHPLRNGDQDYPGGDHLQVATPWAPPVAEDALKDANGDGAEKKERELLALLSRGLGGERYSFRKQDAERWAGAPLMDMTGCSEHQAKELLKGWLAKGLITVEAYTSDKQRKPRQGIFVAPSTSAAGGIFD